MCERSAAGDIRPQAPSQEHLTSGDTFAAPKHKRGVSQDPGEAQQPRFYW